MGVLLKNSYEFDSLVEKQWFPEYGYKHDGFSIINQNTNEYLIFKHNSSGKYYKYTFDSQIRMKEVNKIRKRITIYE